jgi:phosphohistidine swiveling domain-containing protein
MKDVDKVEWTSFRALEPNPYPFTPMTQSLLRSGLENSSLVKLLNEPAEAANFHRGYLFFSFKQIHRFLSSFVSIRKSVLADYCRDERDSRINTISFRPSVSGLVVGIHLSLLLIRGLYRAILAGHRLHERPEVVQLDNRELLSGTDAHRDYLEKSIEAHILISGLAEIYGVAVDRYIPFSPNRSRIQFLLTRWTDSKTAEMAWKASRVSDEQQLDVFLSEFGHRCDREMELAAPRWSDVPFGISNFEAYHDTQHTEAIADSTLKSLVWQILLIPGTLLERMRENPKNEWLKSYAYLRKLLLEIGRRAVDSGHLEHQEDIFYLSIETTQKLMTASPSRQHIHETVKQAKRRHTENEEYDPPLFMGENFEPNIRPVGNGDDWPSELEGVGVSPGTVTGRAILAKSPEDVVLGNDEQPKLLVTEFTDAGWTPLFYNIDGLIMERGSMLSHGSIVAREVGIPAVANVGSTKNQIRQNDRVRIDGEKGLVEIVDKTATRSGGP